MSITAEQRYINRLNRQADEHNKTLGPTSNKDMLIVIRQARALIAWLLATAEQNRDHSRASKTLDFAHDDEAIMSNLIRADRLLEKSERDT